MGDERKSTPTPAIQLLMPPARFGEPGFLSALLCDLAAGRPLFTAGADRWPGPPLLVGVRPPIPPSKGESRVRSARVWRRALEKAPFVAVWVIPALGPYCGPEKFGKLRHASLCEHSMTKGRDV